MDMKKSFSLQVNEFLSTSNKFLIKLWMYTGFLIVPTSQFYDNQLYNYLMFTQIAFFLKK